MYLTSFHINENKNLLIIIINQTSRHEAADIQTDQFNELSILRTDRGQSAEFLAALEGFIQFRIVQHEHVLVVHEHLEGVHTYKQTSI